MFPVGCQCFFSFRLFLTVAIFRKKDSQCQINNYSSWSLILSTIEMASKCCSNNTHLCCIIHYCYPVFPCVTLCCLVLPRVTHDTLCYPPLPCVTLCYPVLLCVTLCFPCVTLCYPVLLCVTLCFPCVTLCYPVFPSVTLCYPMLP